MSYPDTKPLTAQPVPALSYPAVVGATAPATPHQGMIWLDNSASPIVLKIYDNNVWTPVQGSGAGGTLTANDVIPFFKGKYSVGTSDPTNANNQLPPTNPKEGDIWFNPLKQDFSEFKGGAWNLWNFATATRSLGLLGDLANVDMSGGADYGDTLVWHRESGLWQPGAAFAHITNWDKSTAYAFGTTVYYKGGLFEANRDTVRNESPEFADRQAWFYHREKADGSGAFAGPFHFSYIHQVGDATVAPTDKPPKDVPTYALQWQDDSHWSVWVWDLRATGWRPGMATPTYQWWRMDDVYPGRATNIWRTWSSPSSRFGTFVVWVYGDPKNVTQPPVVGSNVWTLRSIRQDLSALHDVVAPKPNENDTLLYEGGYWIAKPRGVYAKWNPIDSYNRGTYIDYLGEVYSSRHKIDYSASGANPVPDSAIGAATFYFTPTATGTHYDGPHNIDVVNVVPLTTVPTQVPPTTWDAKEDYRAANVQADLVNGGYTFSIWKYNFTTKAWVREDNTYGVAGTDFKANTYVGPGVPPQSLYGRCALKVFDPNGVNPVPVPANYNWTWVPQYVSMTTITGLGSAASRTDGDLIAWDNTTDTWKVRPHIAAAPANATSPGFAGQIAYDATHVYHCVATNQWVRIARDTTGGW